MRSRSARRDRTRAPYLASAHSSPARWSVPSGGDDSNPRFREPCSYELLREVIARGEQEVRSPQGEPIQRGLPPRANSGVVDAAGRLMEDGDQWNGETARRQGGTCERRCDRVEKDGARPELLRATKHCRPAESCERKRPLG